jgi:alpha-D-ribose 1-methylphosphonate 5-triphosphate synthase subunit PhnG
MLTGNQIEFARLLTLRKMLKLEMYGMTRRGRSAYSILKKELGLTGNKQKVYDQVCAMCDSVLQGEKRQFLRDELIEKLKEEEQYEKSQAKWEE